MSIWSTASALIDAVRVRQDWTGATDAQLYDMLNVVQERLQREHDFTFQEEIATRTLGTGATGFARFAEPTDGKQLNAMYLIESSARVRLTFLPFYDFLATYPNPSRTGTAEHWTIRRNEVYVGPALATAVTAEAYYYKMLPALTATASNDFLVFAPDTLFYGTCREQALHVGETQAATTYQSLLGDSVASLLRQHRGRKMSPRRSMVMRTPGTVFAPNQSLS
jgi:hypothetical protein